VQDINPGPYGSFYYYPSEFIQVGNRLFFTANDVVSDHELWSGRAAIMMHQPARAVQDLKDEVTSLNLPKGVTKSLIVKLNAAGEAIGSEQNTDAVLALEDFMSFLDQRSPKKIPAADAADLGEFAQDLINLLEGVFP
jgi:hypothetical protein